ncbi:hypothetical protein BS47DRAFT_1293097 [Hydnum rufescens UP504]|uniref:Uncharacterized protein n=1 Tax=Hydnum rufescens UP504 TaxID=1448309 RepID=A0A9P6DW78_9AGAM|nr:hypothetical protein BS47DRAFT_1293097 [Hydnum rufescens UP504]
MMQAYSFTDYHAQGQTIPYVLVDLAQPPTRQLTAFNAYVALSRSSGKDTICLIRDFDDTLFTTPACEILEAEDTRLRELDRSTQESIKHIRQ